MKSKLLLSVLFTLLMTNNLLSQNTALFNRFQDSIVFYENKLKLSVPEEERKAADKKILAFIAKAARQQKSMDYGFDSLNIVSVLTSDDKMLRIFTWMIPYDNGRYGYNGLIQAYNKNKKKYSVEYLYDFTERITQPMKKLLSPKKWYGARYYKLITKKYRGRRYYTVLGWKGIDPTITAKVVDVIDVKSNGKIVFGYNLFYLEKYKYFEKYRRPKRLVYKYSAKASMNLRYEKQTVLKLVKKSKLKSTPITRSFKSQKKEVRTKPKYKKIVANMIVMDQLMPLNKSMTGFYQFYIPKVNVVDALVFEKGKWKYYKDIDARNEGKSPERKDVIDYELFEEEDE
jgi:hypothetical protein